MEAVRSGHSTKYLVTDLGSSNGTWLNRAKLRRFTDAECRAGDIISFGTLENAFRLTPARPGAKPPLAVEQAIALLKTQEVSERWQCVTLAIA